MYEHLLPIGSVVQLKDAEKYIMIFGILQKCKTAEDEIIEYDYIGVPYPAGYINSSFTIGFNHDQIEEVLFMGFENEDMWTRFKKTLEYAQKINEKRGEIIKK